MSFIIPTLFIFKYFDMLSVKQLLEKLKLPGKYQEVLFADSDGNLMYIYLRYNQIRHKYYLQNKLTSVQRQTIGKREAEVLISKTLNLLLKSSRVK